MLDLVPQQCRCSPYCRVSVLLTADHIREIVGHGRLLIITGHDRPKPEECFTVAAHGTDPDGKEYDEFQPP